MSISRLQKKPDNKQKWIDSSLDRAQLHTFLSYGTGIHQLHTWNKENLLRVVSEVVTLPLGYYRGNASPLLCTGQPSHCFSCSRPRTERQKTSSSERLLTLQIKHKKQCIMNIEPILRKFPLYELFKSWQLYKYKQSKLDYLGYFCSVESWMTSSTGPSPDLYCFYTSFILLIDRIKNEWIYLIDGLKTCQQH